MRQSIRTAKTIPLLLLIALLASCTVNLISPYNQALVDNLTGMQKSVNLILIEVQQNFGKPEASYANFAKRYAEVNADLLNALSMTKAIAHSEITVKQLLVLQRTLNRLETMQQKGFSSSKEVKVIQDTINDDFTGIYKLQYAKKKYLPKE